MPTSYPHNISPLLERIIGLRPTSVLDIGTGYGKWGWLCREYLDDFAGRMRIDGVEAFRDYVHRSPAAHVYDLLLTIEFPGPMDGALADDYDLVLMIDVLEHYTRADGERALQAALQRSPQVLISTPLNFPQGAVNGNEFEVHRSEWRPEDLTPFGAWSDFSDERSTRGLLRRVP
jgi:2-polyprenyl-3-methyl-5-hydroxy-6-metoxy-1,4-benzoquinol methylase